MRSMIAELYPLPAAAAAAAPVPSTFLCPLTGAVMRDPVIDIENNRHTCRRNAAYIHTRTRTGIGPLHAPSSRPLDRFLRLLSL